MVHRIWPPTLYTVAIGFYLEPEKFFFRNNDTVGKLETKFFQFRFLTGPYTILSSPLE